MPIIVLFIVYSSVKSNIIIFGLLLQKCKNKYLSCVIAALIFTLPHIFNTDNISVLVMFIFPFLYGIFANEMFYTTKSIWMPTGFHWLWNYTITSLFLVTGTQSFIYVHIIAAMIIMIPLFYIVIGKTRLKKTSPQKLWLPPKLEGKIIYIIIFHINDSFFHFRDRNPWQPVLSID